jgi:proline dehydrogenase
MNRVLDRAAQRYIAGPDLADAMRTSARLAARGLTCTIGYWDGAADSPEAVASQAAAISSALEAAALDGYPSVKATALQFNPRLLAGITTSVHFDSMDVQAAGSTLDLAASLPSAGVTLPSRWWRSRDDAERVVELQRPVRVVKGQFHDVASEPDHRTGYVDLVDRLAGRAPFVAVATHDAALAKESLRRLRACGTPCELQLLYGLPIERALQRTGERTARVYVPYGAAFRPYAIRRIGGNPRSLAWLARDLLLSRR